jgi:hypothetical protein
MAASFLSRRNRNQGSAIRHIVPRSFNPATGDPISQKTAISAYRRDRKQLIPVAHIKANVSPSLNDLRRMPNTLPHTTLAAADATYK